MLFLVPPPQPTQLPPSIFQGIDDEGEGRRKINQYSSANRPQFPASFHVAAWLIILTLGLYWTIELVTFSRKMYRRANEAAINREEDEILHHRPR